MLCFVRKGQTRIFPDMRSIALGYRAPTWSDSARNAGQFWVYQQCASVSRSGTSASTSSVMASNGQREKFSTALVAARWGALSLSASSLFANGPENRVVFGVECKHNIQIRFDGDDFGQ